MPTTAPASSPAISPAISNAKGELIATCRTQGLGDPSFESVPSGPGHAPWFRTTVLLGERELGHGEGRSKRDAERAASLEALQTLAPVAQPVAQPTAAGTTVPGTSAPTAPAARWPIYADVLSQALLVAHERSDDGELPQVAADAAELYRRLLAELGHNPETP